MNLKELREEIKNYEAGIKMVEERWLEWGYEYKAFKEDFEFWKEEKKNLEFAKQCLLRESYKKSLLKKENK